MLVVLGVTHAESTTRSTASEKLLLRHAQGDENICLQRCVPGGAMRFFLRPPAEVAGVDGMLRKKLVHFERLPPARPCYTRVPCKKGPLFRWGGRWKEPVQRYPLGAPTSAT